MSTDRTLSPANILTAQTAGAINTPSATKNSEKAVKAAKDFEAVFVSEMMKPMFETVDVDDTFGGGHGEEVFRGFMSQEYGKMISAQGGIGIASKVQAELLKAQEHKTTPLTTAQGE